MQLTFIINDAAMVAALSRATAAYNKRNPAVSDQDFLRKLVFGQLDNLVAAYTVAEMDPVQFQRERFTADERAKIRLASKTSGSVADLLALLDHPRARVRFNDPLVIDGLSMLVDAGLLEPHRPAEILAF